MTKATHYGTCQACGREHKLPNDRLSKHGYTVTWNEFWNVCRGEKELPYEKSCDLIEFLIKDVEDQKARILAEIEELKSTTEFAWFFERQKIGRYQSKSVAVKKFADDLEWNDNQLTWTGTDGSPQKYAHWQADGTKLTAMADANEAKIRSLKQQVKGCENYIEWQQGRIDNWELKECKEVEVEVPVNKETREFENRREGWAFSSKMKKAGHRTRVCNNRYGGNKVTVYFKD